MALFPTAAKHQQMREFSSRDAMTRFGTIDGRTDFRGFPLHTELRYFRASDLDFSLARPQPKDNPDSLIFVTFCILSNCSFKRVFRFHQCCGTYTRCDFAHSNFVKGRLSGQFLDCGFDNTNMNKTLLGDTFERCSFRNVNFKRASLSMCRFVNCEFVECDLTGAWFGKDLNKLPTERMEIFAPLSGTIQYTDT